VAIKYQIIREMALTRTDLAIKYLKDTLLKHVAEPQLLTNLVEKTIRSEVSISDILTLTRQAGLRLNRKAYLNMLLRAKDPKTTNYVYEQWVSQDG